MTPDERPINRPVDEWVAKLRYSRSFTSKLMLSDPSVKQTYATLANALMGYDKMRARTTWGGVQFSIGRRIVARIGFGGKTLVVCYALDPARYAEGKYRLSDVSEVKRLAATPGKLRITSGRSLAYALRLIEDLAREQGLTACTVASPVRPEDYPTDTFDNLLARGLIRLLKSDAALGDEEGAEEDAEAADDIENEATSEGDSVPSDADAVAEEPAPEDAEAPAEEASAQENAPAEEATLAPLEAPAEVLTTQENVPSADGAEVASTPEQEAYRDTLSSVDGLTARHEVYQSLLDAVKGSAPDVRLTKRSVLSPINEAWVVAIENCLSALDEVTRNPGHFIEENEELLPIERTKKVTQRSIQHLSQHSGLISRIEGDTIIPSKLLNVFRDDSLMTYENKFVNTLLLRLYDFVALRYEAAKEGADREVTALDLENRVEFADAYGKVTVHVELSSPREGKGRNYAAQTDLWKRVKKLYETVCDYQGSAFVREMGNAYIRPPVMRTNPILKNKNLSQCLELWEFIETYEDEDGLVNEEVDLEVAPDYLAHLYRDVATQYLTFRVGAVGAKEWQAPEAIASQTTQPTHAPRTVRAAAEAVASDEEEADARLWAVEAALAADLILDEMGRESRENEYAQRQARLAEMTEEPIAPPETPHSVVDATPVSMPDRAEPVDWGEEPPASSATEEQAESEERTEVVRMQEDGARYREVTTYRKSLQAKLQLADDVVKSHYVGIYNRFVSKNRVRARLSFEYVTFAVGGKPLARMTIIGKTLRVYYALDPQSVAGKYGVKDASDVKKYAATPSLLYVRGNRSYVYALDLADQVLSGLGPATKPAYTRVEDYPYRTREALLAAGLIQRTVTTLPMGQSVYAAKTVPMALRNTTPDGDYRADYLAEAKKMMAKEKEAPFRTLNLEGVVKSSEVLAVLNETDTQLEKERKERLAKEAKPTKPVEGGDGDAIMVNSAAISTAVSESDMTSVPVPEAPAAPKPKAPVPMGGDALLPKPLTLDEIGKDIPSREDTSAEESTPRKGLRLWRRRKKKRT